MKRSVETTKINSELEIVRLKSNVKFKHPLGDMAPTGYCFKHPEKGYFAFDNNYIPYIPCGGKKALQSIIDTGGFLNYKDTKWIQPIIPSGIQE